MRFRKLVVPAMVFVMFVGLAYTGYLVTDHARRGAAQTNSTVTNETVNQQVGNWQLTSRSTNRYTTRFGKNVTVYNASGHELTKGEDYEWNATDGAIRYASTDSTNDGNTSTITYEYYSNTQPVKDLDGPISSITRGVGSIGYLASGLALVVFIISLGGIVAKLFGDDSPTTRR